MANRANQLLLAAATGEPVEPLTPEEEAWFELMDALDELPADEAFSLLVDAEPRLGGVARDFIAQVRSLMPNGSCLDNDAQDQLWKVLGDQLDPLVGADATAENPLLRSKTAFHLARVHIATEAGLDLDAEDEADD